MKFQVNTRAFVFTACFSALLVLSSYLNISLGFTPVPISMQNFVVMLAGAILGPIYGFCSMALVVLLTALGLPIIHGNGGMALLLGPTGGFIWMYPVAAFFIGLVSQRLKGNRQVKLIGMILAMELFGSLLLYVTGVPWLAHVYNFTFQKAMSAGCYPYLPGDAAKAVIGGFIAVTVSQVFPMQRILGHNRYGAKHSSHAA